MTLTFDLETGAHYCTWGGQLNLPTNFGVSRTFRSRLTCHHLSDTLRDLATLTFDLGGHGACRSRGVRAASVYQVRSPSRSEDIGHLLCEHYSRPGDLDL